VLSYDRQLVSIWDIEWLVTQDGKERVVPGLRFLTGIDEGPRTQLLAIVDSVRTVGGPDHWADATSHARMRGDLHHLHEARDKQGETLYRLFLLWQREAKRVIVIDGRSKPNGTALAEAEYEAIEALANSVDGDPAPFATTDDVVRLLVSGGEV
jgi:hypothetical protein